MKQTEHTRLLSGGRKDGGVLSGEGKGGDSHSGEWRGGGVLSDATGKAKAVTQAGRETQKQDHVSNNY